MSIVETTKIPLAEVEIEDSLQDTFDVLNLEIGSMVEAAVVDPLILYPEGLVHSTRDLYPLSIQLVTFDRNVRSDRKLDKALRKRLSSENFDGADGVLVFPYDSKLPEDNLHQSLIEIYPKGMDHMVSVQRYVTSHEVARSGRILHDVAYSLTVAPLVDSPLRKSDMDSPTVNWLVDSMNQGDYEEVAQILREKYSHVQNRQVLGLLWRKLRLLEADKIADLTVYPDEVKNINTSNTESVFGQPAWIHEGLFNGLKNPLLAEALIKFASEEHIPVPHMDFEAFKSLLHS